MKALTIGFVGLLLALLYVGVTGTQQAPITATSLAAQSTGDNVVRTDGPGPFVLTHFFGGHLRPYRGAFYGSRYPYYGGYSWPYSYYRPYRYYGKGCYWNGYSYICSYPNYWYRYW